MTIPPRDLRALADENDRLRGQVDALERDNARLAALYVATTRLLGTRSVGDVLAAIHDVVVNLVGSEELAVFERRGDALVLVSSFGLDPATLARVPADLGPLGEVVQSGAVWLAPPGGFAARAPHEEHLTACVPLRGRGGVVVGAVAVYRLLSHKGRFVDVDVELFELLATHAGAAIAAANDAP